MDYCWFIGFDGFQMSFLSRFPLNHRFSWVISQKGARDWPSLADNDNSQQRLTTWRRLNLDKTSRTLTYKRNPSLLWPTPTVWRNDSSALKWLIVTFGCVGEPCEVEMSRVIGAIASPAGHSLTAPRCHGFAPSRNLHSALERSRKPADHINHLA